MIKRMSITVVTALGLLASGVASAGAIETNLSGLFLKGEHAQIRFTGLSNAGVNFRLASGNITPGEGCMNGPADCLTLWGWATRSENPNQFLYANENGQCVFMIRNDPEAIVIHGLRGDCGTDEMNRRALKSVEGTYQPAQ